MKRYVFFINAALHSGGAPEDYHTLAYEIAKIGNEVIIFHKGTAGRSKYKEISYIDFNFSQLQMVLRNKDKKETSAIVIGYSSLWSLAYTGLCKLLGIRVTLIAVNQINRFLDFDNPFSKNVVPSITNIESGKLNTKSNGSNIFERSNQGTRGISSTLRYCIRKTYKFTFGALLVFLSDKIAVFSNNEKKEIVINYPYTKEKIIFYTLGAEIKEKMIGADKFDNNKINITMWCRVDFFYKGIDTLFEYLENIDKAVKDNIQFSIIGPDYNDGYTQVRNKIEQQNLMGSVQLVTSDDYTKGTVGYFYHSDYILSLSKWDGFPRTLREAVEFGIPTISNSESNFDMISKATASNFIVDSKYEFEQLMLKISSFNKTKNIKAKAQDYIGLLSWESSARQFIKNV